MNKPTVKCFKWVRGVNDAEYIELLLNALDRQKKITAKAIDKLKKVDAVPVKHGHWKEVSDGWDGVYYECSECGLSWTLNEGTTEENEMFYCPKCGTKMDGERREE